MKILYFDCMSGISGDMTLGAFIDAGLPREKLLSLPEKLHLPQVVISIDKVRKNDIAATQVLVDFPPEQPHRHLQDIHKILNAAELSDTSKQIAKRIFQKLAVAEARVHDTSIEKVHFHEVGALDAVIDIAGTALAFDFFDIEKAWVRSIPVGGGTIKCAHGLLPVPAPATAILLENFSVKYGSVGKELVTPTGAAILATLVTPCEVVPEFKIIKSGFGAGTGDFKDMPNVLRIFRGEASGEVNRDSVWQVECNIDDMNPEIVPYIIEKLIAAGALDAWATPVLMKKGRPGFVLAALAPVEVHDAVCEIIFQETTTIGLREILVRREKLQRENIEIDTEFGPVLFKKIQRPQTGTQLVPEFETCKKVARAHGLPLRIVYERLQKMANQFIS